MSTTVTIKDARPQEGEPLCRTCRWVHMQRGFRESEEAIFCDYGTLRPVRFKVAECTNYVDRTIPSRSEMEDMALLINVEPARDKAGFTRAISRTWMDVEKDKEDCASKIE